MCVISVVIVCNVIYGRKCIYKLVFHLEVLSSNEVENPDTEVLFYTFQTWWQRGIIEASVGATRGIGWLSARSASCQAAKTEHEYSHVLVRFNHCIFCDSWETSKFVANPSVENHFRK